MTSIEETVQRVIAEVCDIAPDQINPEWHIFSEIGVDSLAFLDIVYDIDQELKIKIPIEAWLSAKADSADPQEYFKLKNFIAVVKKAVEATA